jgi:hypothetical protein
MAWKIAGKVKKSPSSMISEAYRGNPRHIGSLIEHGHMPTGPVPLLLFCNDFGVSFKRDIMNTSE